MVGRQLPFFSVIVPFWLVCAFAGWRGMLEVWPAMLVAGVGFADAAVPGVELSRPVARGRRRRGRVAGAGGVVPARVASRAHLEVDGHRCGADRQCAARMPALRSDGRNSHVWRAWTPWIILSVVVFIWGLPAVKAWLDGLSVIRVPVPCLHKAVLRVPPVVPAPHAEAAIFAINWLSATGSGIFVAAIIAGLAMGCVVRRDGAHLLAHAEARAVVAASRSAR